MQARSWTAAAVQAGLTIFASLPAHAENGRFGASSDIMGLTLTMSQDEATKLIEANHPGAVITPLPYLLTVSGSKKQGMIGFVADLATKDDNAANQRTAEQQQKELDARKAAGFGDSMLNRTVGAVGDVAQDRLKILFNPNDGASDIFGISRYTEYVKGKQPLTQTVIAALTEKYGTPSRTGGDNRTLIIYTWTGVGAAQRPKGSLAHCFDEAGYDLVYEDTGEGGFSGMPWFVHTTGERFVSVVNLIHAKNPFQNFGFCGTVLQFKLKLTQNGDYVGGMGTRLLDLSKAYVELKTFGDDLSSQTSAAKQKQMDQDSGIRPKL
ncbi:MAG: hypothetical protein P4M05_33550 [Bradyrhizobium sp.]|nr:hypothetical protein [Bradyrhizobium sp.]